jgi:hypothetical protein
MVASFSYFFAELFEDAPIPACLFLEGEDLLLACFGPSPIATRGVLMDRPIFESELPDLIAQCRHRVCEDGEEERCVEWVEGCSVV